MLVTEKGRTMLPRGGIATAPRAAAPSAAPGPLTAIEAELLSELPGLAAPVPP